MAASVEQTVDPAKDGEPIPLSLSSSRKTKKKKLIPSALDVSIMGTNDSSIVSKRSVERLYLPEPHFFRHFVKKPKRRSPLINRGYLLRMKTIEHELDRFILDSSLQAKKVVVNLGCGYDPLPFSFLARQQSAADGISFVDVDYPSLIKNKIVMIQASSEISALLKDLRQASSETLMLTSEQYHAVGCDLSQPAALETVLRSLFDTEHTSFCFVAEVSITYMKEKDADRLIRWASNFAVSRFCLLEQCLPWTREHPFAATMLNHFAKFGTKLRSLKNYPTIELQQKRFLDRGWETAQARSLWGQWSDSDFIEKAEKLRYNRVEPFDEWEEFVLFAQHYFILVAKSGDTGSHQATEKKLRIDKIEQAVVEEIDVGVPSRPTFAHFTCKAPVRNYGAIFSTPEGEIGHHGGYGPQKRLANSDIFSCDKTSVSSRLIQPPIEAGERMCHTMTMVGTNVLLVGGRTSPDRALSDCWTSKGDRWEKIESLPHGLYRHSAVALSLDGGRYVLICGGKTGKGEVSKGWYLCHLSATTDDFYGKWTCLETEDKDCEPRFGASICRVSSGLDSCSGLLMGGMSESGTLLDSIIQWSLNLKQSKITLRHYEHGRSLDICRFGAQLLQRQIEDGRSQVFLIGGIASSLHHPLNFVPILAFDPELDSSSDTLRITQSNQGFDINLHNTQGPLLTGHSAILIENSNGPNHIFITGGGAVCFSFGSYHNKSAITISDQHSSSGYLNIMTERPEHLNESHLDRQTERQDSVSAPTDIQIKRKDGSHNFRKILSDNAPSVMVGLDLGSCIHGWTADGLKDRIGQERQVTVHFSQTNTLDFRRRNFEYKKMRFGEFVDLIKSGGQHYLRAVSSESIDQPANFWKDYPELASDFRLPTALSEIIEEQLPTGSIRMHSSVLRLSGPVSMWLHYDVMANVLCQIRGRKQLMLFPPSDVKLFEIPHGQSSSSINMFDPETYAKHSRLSMAHPHLVTLEPGDVLFIPALWLHTAQPIDKFSVAVNVFFRDLDSGYAHGKDAYGNRDLQAYEQGRKDIAKLSSRFQALPKPARQFYLLRLAQELEEAANI